MLNDQDCQKRTIYDHNMRQIGRWMRAIQICNQQNFSRLQENRPNLLIYYYYENQSRQVVLVAEQTFFFYSSVKLVTEDLFDLKLLSNYLTRHINKVRNVTVFRKFRHIFGPPKFRPSKQDSSHSFRIRDIIFQLILITVASPLDVAPEK